jgi:cytochrome b pre-mRNA-processing protein 3
MKIKPRSGWTASSIKCLSIREYRFSDHPHRSKEIMFGLFRNKQRESEISGLYDQILAQGRNPAFFIGGRVPDTVEGRTDMMLLHLFLLMHRLRDEDGEIRELTRGVCDRFFAELDRAMREMGVGDLSVPKKMRKVADIYTGCSAAYGKALANADDAELTEAVLRNVYGRSEQRRREASALADYMRRASVALSAVPAETLTHAPLPFPSPSFSLDASV